MIPVSKSDGIKLALLFSALAMLAQSIDAQSSTGQTRQCAPVSGDRIMGADLASAVPQLAEIPASLNLGYAPVPGIQRVFRASELRRLAERYGIHPKPLEPVCFAWPLHVLSREQILGAVQKTLAGHEIQLEITDQSRNQVPAGEVIFPLQGLNYNSAKATVWNGFITYAEGRKFTTWVLVRLTVHERQLIAKRTIHSGEIIDSTAFQAADYSGPLRRSIILQSEAELAGKCARWAIPEGTVLTASMLSPRPDVEQEETVIVHVISGATSIETQGIAATSGYKGDIIKVRNTKTGRLFLARVDDHGVVTLVAGGDFGLVVEVIKKS
jgi:flagella basal body P-ring formation protein FlgA